MDAVFFLRTCWALHVFTRRVENVYNQKKNVYNKKKSAKRREFKLPLNMAAWRHMQVINRLTTTWKCDLRIFYSRVVCIVKRTSEVRVSELYIYLEWDLRVTEWSQYIYIWSSLGTSGLIIWRLSTRVTWDFHWMLRLFIYLISAESSTQTSNIYW